MENSGGLEPQRDVGQQFGANDVPSTAMLGMNGCRAKSRRYPGRMVCMSVQHVCSSCVQLPSGAPDGPATLMGQAVDSKVLPAAFSPSTCCFSAPAASWCSSDFSWMPLRSLSKIHLTATDTVNVLSWHVFHTLMADNSVD